MSTASHASWRPARPIIGRRLELNALHQDGREIPIELSIAAHHDGGGYICSAFARDISERKATAERLAQGEEQLRDLINNIPALVGYFDADERCRFANDTALRVQGVKRSEGIGMSLRTMIGESSYAQHEPSVRQALLGRRAQFAGTAPHRLREAYFEAYLSPDIQAGGEVRGFYLMTFDVTALKEAQLRQQQSERRLRAITDNLPVMISYIDRDERFTFMNQTFREWTGVDTAAIGQHIGSRSADPALYEQRRARVAEALQGKRVTFEIESKMLGVRRVLRNDYIPDIQPDGAVAGIYTMSIDVTALKDVELQLQALARFDSLTGLANRRRFNEMLPEAIARTTRAKQAIALLFLDVDHFKSINDNYGHAAGDAVLEQFAGRLQASLRKTDIVARLAGDEFVIILEGLHSQAEAEAIADKVLTEVRRPFELDGQTVAVTTSIGLALHDSGPIDPAALLAQADAALYEAKARGRNAFATSH